MQTNLPPDQLRDLMQQLGGEGPRLAPAPPATVRLDGPTRAILTGVDMPFWSMVTLMIKAGVAAVPAFIVLWVIGRVLSAVGIGLLAAGR